MFYCYNIFQNNIKLCILPIYAMNSRKKILIGSSFMAVYLNSYYLINACHTIENNFKTNIEISARLLNGKYYNLNIDNTKCFKKDDIAITQVDNPSVFYESGNIFFKINNYINNIYNYSTHVIFLGYPYSKNKSFSNGGNLTLVRYTAQIIDYNNSKYDYNYIVCKYLHTNVTETDNNGNERNISNMPQLNGMSGGPIFTINKKSNFNPIWSGIGVEYSEKENIIIGLRNNTVINILDNMINN